MPDRVIVTDEELHARFNEIKGLPNPSASELEEARNIVRQLEARRDAVRRAPKKKKRVPVTERSIPKRSMEDDGLEREANSPFNLTMAAAEEAVEERHRIAREAMSGPIITREELTGVIAEASGPLTERSMEIVLSPEQYEDLMSGKQVTLDPPPSLTKVEKPKSIKIKTHIRRWAQRLHRDLWNARHPGERVPANRENWIDLPRAERVGTRIVAETLEIAVGAIVEDTVAHLIKVVDESTQYLGPERRAMLNAILKAQAIVIDKHVEQEFGHLRHDIQAEVVGMEAEE